MPKRKLIAAVAIAAILISLALGFFQLRLPSTDLAIHQALGWGAAQETARLVGSQGEIVVICPDFGEFKILNPRYEVLLKSYRKSLAKSTQLRIIALERAPVEPPTVAKVGVYLSPEQYDNFSQKHAKAGAIVVLVGLPPLSDASIREAQAAGAKWLVVSHYGAGYKRLLARQAMQRAIVPRLDEVQEFPKPRTLQERFEREYDVLNPDRVAQLPD
jgi:hypothetical protein